MRNLNIKIECGDRTCASEPGKFCTFLGSKQFGTRFACCLFPDDRGDNTPLHEDVTGGWLQRCPRCLAAEHGDTIQKPKTLAEVFAQEEREKLRTKPV